MRLLVLNGESRRTDEGVQFIHGTVAFDTQVVFRNPLAASEAGLSLVALFGVDPIQREPGFVECLLLQVKLPTHCNGVILLCLTSWGTECYTELCNESIGVCLQMAKNCELCGRGPLFGNRISHAHNVTKRRWNVNLQSVRALVKGASKRIKVCTSCIRNGKVQKVA
jgi:large subunit ribosomal protein L28